jgi:Permuted papain-like amidase enzyme, YaeF/YiiX, C92 family
MKFPLKSFFAVCALQLLLTGCATDLKIQEGSAIPTLGFQSNFLNPSNGGRIVRADELEPGDIVLTADNGYRSLGVRLMTFSPVSHAAVYMADQQIAEAVGSGIRLRTVQQFLDEEATVVVFRHPRISKQAMRDMQAFVTQHIGQKYNYFGIMLQVPFTIERRVCELPLVPSLIRDFCIQGIASIQLGLGRNDQFFCSQFVLEAFNRAGLSLTDADPRLVSPRDILHMREGDIPSIKIRQTLQYVGHLKAPPQVVAHN